MSTHAALPGSDAFAGLDAGAVLDVLDAVSDLVVIVDASGQITAMNKAALGACDVDDDSSGLIGRSFAEVFGPASGAGAVEETVVAELAGGAFGPHLVLAMPTPLDDARVVRWSARFLAAVEGKAPRIVATGVDITRLMMENRRLSEAVRRYRTLLDAASDVVICVDENGTVTHLSDAVRSQLGYIPSEWIGKPAFGLVHPDDLALTVENFIATVDRTASSAPGTLRVLHASGEYHLYEVYAKNLLDAPEVAGVVVSMRDISERVRHDIELDVAQQAQRLAERQFQSSFDHAPIGMALVAIDGAFLRVNNALCELVGRHQADLLARTFQDITHPDDLAADVALLDALLIGERLDYQIDKRYLRPDGSEVWAQLNVTLVRNQHGHPMHFVAQIQDISERRRLHAALVEAAQKDSLTGLVNRSGFQAQLATACAEASSEAPVSVIFLDLNGFKGVNDTFGHAFGDLVLQQVSARMRSALRPGDVAARLGGDELAAILVGADEVGAELVTTRLREAIAEPMEVQGDWINLTASIGLVTTTAPVDPSGLLESADAAMYDDKRSR